MQAGLPLGPNPTVTRAKAAKSAAAEEAGKAGKPVKQRPVSGGAAIAQLIAKGAPGEDSKAGKLRALALMPSSERIAHQAEIPRIYSEVSTEILVILCGVATESDELETLRGLYNFSNVNY